MNPRPFIFALSLVLNSRFAVIAAETKPSAPVVPTTTASTTVGFDTFRLIGERNIFNPNRISRTPLVSAEATPPRVDLITLVGTMNSEKNLYAFFESTDRNYRKALHEGGAISLYTIKRIMNDGVELVRDGKSFTLKIGQQLQRPDGGDWTVVAGEIIRAPTTETNAGTATSQAPAAPPEGASDTLKRLMEQRQKQLKQ